MVQLYVVIFGHDIKLKKMINNKKERHNWLSDNKTSQSPLKKKIKIIAIFFSYLFSNKPTIPAKPDNITDRICPESDENDFTKYAQTLFDEEPPIFNNY